MKKVVSVCFLALVGLLAFAQVIKLILRVSCPADLSDVISHQIF